MAKKEYEIKVKTDEKSLTDTYGKFIIQPLERGYGVTVGNALRRVLMTTLPKILLKIYLKNFWNGLEKDG